MSGHSSSNTKSLVPGAGARPHWLARSLAAAFLGTVVLVACAGASDKPGDPPPAPTSSSGAAKSPCDGKYPANEYGANKCDACCQDYCNDKNVHCNVTSNGDGAGNASFECKCAPKPPSGGPGPGGGNPNSCVPRNSAGDSAECCVVGQYTDPRKEYDPECKDHKCINNMCTYRCHKTDSACMPGTAQCCAGLTCDASKKKCRPKPNTCPPNMAFRIVATGEAGEIDSCVPPDAGTDAGMGTPRVCYTDAPGNHSQAAVMDVCANGHFPSGFDSCTSYTASCIQACKAAGFAAGTCAPGSCRGLGITAASAGGCGYPGYEDHPEWDVLCTCSGKP